MTRFRWLLATCLRGIRARWVLSLGSFVLTTIAIASAVVGPSYQLSAANSYVIAQLRAQPTIVTGLTYDYTPRSRQSVDAASTTADRETRQESGRYFPPGHIIVWQPLAETTDITAAKVLSRPTLVSVPGACQHVALHGRCPTRPGEIAVQAGDAAELGLHVGSRTNPYGDPTPFVVTGIYRPRARDAGFWFGLQRLESLPPSPNSSDPAVHLAPWITPQSGIELRSEPWHLTVDQNIATPPTMTPADAQDAADRAKAIGKASDGGSLPRGLSLEVGNSLPAVTHQLLARRDVARSTVAPAVLSLILVALVLLSRLLAAAMSLRRGELALASLRGYGRRQLWFLGMLEPLVVLLCSIPVGVALGYLTSRALAARWLVPGLPVPFVLASGLAVVAVVAVTAAVAAIVVRDAVSEPLSAQIAGVRRPTRPGRLLLVLRLVLVAVAAAALVVAAGRGHPAAPDATDLALPILLAAAAGVLVGLVVLALAGLWVRWSGRRRGLSSYVAARTVRRRREGTLVVLPVTVALTVAVFSVGVSLAAGTWRASAAATEVGAPLSYRTTLSLPRAVGLTHELDPRGRWLMAAGEDIPGADQVTTNPIPRVVVDTTRLARVASWPAQWTPGRSAASVARALGPRRPPLVLKGSTVRVGVDNHVRGEYRQLGLSLQIMDDTGAPREVNLGGYAVGRSSDSARLPNCLRGCTLETISFGGPAALAEGMHGSATIESLTVDGRPVRGALDSPWRAAASQVDTATAVKGVPQLRDGHLTVHVSARSSSSYAGISPTDVPAVIPVLWGRLATPVHRLPTSSSGWFRVRSAGTAESMPFRGPSGVLIDVTAFYRATTPGNSTDLVYVWARADTPQRIRDALAAHGLADPTTESGARHVLDQDAFALALRLYVVVTALVILLALAGLAATLAVQLPARRHDAASLRVVGVRSRSIMVGVVAEFLVVIGAAAMAGIAAGGVAQYVVVRTVTLGFADTSLTPRVLPSFDAGSAVRLGLAVLALLVVAASILAILTVRGARTSSLRENAR